MSKFPFSNNDPFYSKSEPESQLGSQALGVAGIFGTGAAIFGAGFINTSSGNVFDTYYKASRVLGQSVPMGLIASLRIPEMLSPFTSQNFQSGGTGHVVFDQDYLRTPETLQFLSGSTKVPESVLKSHGIGSGASLRFERAAGIKGRFGQGSLIVNNAGTETVLSDSMMLAERTHTLGDPFSTRTNINQFAEGLSSVVADGVNSSKAFTHTSSTGTTIGAHRWIPVPSITGSTSSIADMWNRVTYFRGYSAFAAQRPIKAIETMAENIPVIGESLQPLMHRLGLPQGSTAVKTYARLAGFSAKIAGAGIAVSQYNWWMKYQSDDSIAKRELGYTVSSGLVSLAAGWIGRSQRTGLMSQQLMSMHGKAAAIAGISSFIGQNLLPGFDKGVYAGVSGTLTSLNILKSRVGEITGLSSYRRTLEETFPGFSGFGVSVLAGGVGYAAVHAVTPGQGRYKRFAQHLSTDLGTTGFRDTMSALYSRPISSSFDTIYEGWEKVSHNVPYGTSMAAHKAGIAGGGVKVDLPYQAENVFFNEQMTPRPVGPGLPAHYGQYASASFSEKAMLVMQHGAKDIHAKYKGIGLGTVAFVSGMLGHRLASTGLGLGTIETPEQLERQATGEEWVPVRKSRWWGGGGTPWEGGKISHFKPSLNAMIQSDSDARSVWGEDVMNISPLKRFFLKNFTYHLEETNYYNRPYPISSPAFSDLPVIGDIVGSTIGALIKPVRLMHTDEWVKTNEDTGDSTYLTVPGKLDSNPSLRIGGTGSGAPISPYSPAFVLGQQQYKLRELQGLLGFTKNVIQEAYTGSETFTPNSPVLASSSQMTSATDRYWDLELGGLASTTEMVRRFLPKDRLETRNRYNPILNTMPSWMPDEFKRGDQYATQSSGFARLPGEGFAALYTELKGVDPENYPLWYRHMILGSVSPYSEEFRMNKAKLYGMRKAGLLSDDINAMVDRVDQQVIDQRQRRNFYQEGPGNLDDPAIQRTARNAYFGLIDSMRKMTAPIEYLSPFRPFQKFLPVGTALDDYENNFIYGSEMAMWKPSAAIREFFGPSFLAVLRNVGYDFIPPDVQEKRSVDEYFDKLTYYKYMTLAIQAKEQGNGKKAFEYEKYAHKTIYGVNPFGHALSIYGALPEAEKSHYDAFSQTTDPKERERLMQILPENQKKLFAAIWAKRDGIGAKYSANEGVNNQYQAEYRSSGSSGKMKYADFARMKELEQYFSSKSLPREDWLGWHADVDLNDVKLNYVKKEGWDIHDFNMWENQEMLLARKPYVEGLETDIKIDYKSGITGQITQMLARFSTDASDYSHQLVRNNQNSFIPSSSVTYIRDDREAEIAYKYKQGDEK